MDDEQIQQLEQLIETLERFGATTADTQKLTDAMKRSQAEGLKVFSDLMTAIKDGAKQFTDRINTIDSQIKQLGNSQQEAERKKQLFEERGQAQRAQAYAKFNTDIQNFGKSLMEDGVKRVGSFANELMNGTDDFTILAKTLKSGVNIISLAFSTLAGSLTGITKILPGAGKLIGGFSKALDVGAEVAGKTLNFAIDMISAELQKTVKTFYDTTAVGATFTKGLEQMRNAATDNFLTLEQFGRVLVAQSGNISRAGLGFEEAARRAAGVSQDLANTGARDSLLRLGYSFEEQSSLIFETMADMRRGGLLQRSSDAQIAQQTQAYAENLRTIAAITGEDARKRMQEARSQSANMAVQQQLLAMQQRNPEALQKINAMLATMPAELQKGFLQMATLGTVVDQTTNIAMAQTPAIRDALTTMVGAFKDGTVSQRQAVQEVGRQRALMNQGFQDTIDVTGAMGMAAIAGVGGPIGEAAAFQASLYRQVSGQTQATIDSITASLNGQKSSTNEFTTKITETIKDMQELRIGLQDALLKGLKPYVAVQKEFTGWMVSALNKLTGTDINISGTTGTTGIQPQDTLSKLEDRADIGLMDKFVGMMLGQGDLALLDQKDKALADQIRILREYKANEDNLANLSQEMTKLNGELDRIKESPVSSSGDQQRSTEINERLKTITQEMASSAKHMQQWSGTVDHITKINSGNQGTEKQFALGGVASGPISGYSATLHGKEAVVPLPDGDSIPVTMKSPTGSGDGQAQMLEVLQRQLDELRNQTGLTYDMIKHLEKGNRTSREILTSSY